MTSVAIIVPFRDRGRDPLRQANINYVLDHWRDFGADDVLVCSDRRDGDAQFNRHAAYNLGAEHATADVLIFAESDMLICYPQVREAVHQAAAAPGLVVPFTQYRYLSLHASEEVRARRRHPGDCIPLHTMDNGRSIGAINVLSRTTLEAVGCWDEQFEGNWYDDNAMHRAFEVAAGPTRWVEGPAHHLYHLPSHGHGDHITDADRAATAANKARWRRYQRATTAAQIRELTTGAA